MRKLPAYLAAAVAATLIGFGAAPAIAQTGADFFNGKTVTYVVSTAPGGGYDTVGRLMARYMEKYLPGSTFVVLNLPGAGHMIGANTIYASEPDGLTIGTFNTGLIYSQIAENAGVQFDLGQMSWIGKAATDASALMVAEQTPYYTLDDLRNSETEILFAAGGVGAAQYVQARLLIDALALRAKVITGFGGGDDTMAMRRGEIHASIQSRASLNPIVAEGYGRILFQMGGDGGDVPQLRDLSDDPRTETILALVESQGNIGRLTAGPPGIPEDRLQALRNAYEAVFADPDFQAQAALSGTPVDPARGEVVAEMVRAALDQPPEVVEYLKSILEN